MHHTGAVRSSQCIPDPGQDCDDGTAGEAVLGEGVLEVSSVQIFGDQRDD